MKATQKLLNELQEQRLDTALNKTLSNTPEDHKQQNTLNPITKEIINMTAIHQINGRQPIKNRIMTQ